MLVVLGEVFVLWLVVFIENHLIYHWILLDKLLHLLAGVLRDVIYKVRAQIFFISRLSFARFWRFLLWFLFFRSLRGWDFIISLSSTHPDKGSSWVVFLVLDLTVSAVLINSGVRTVVDCSMLGIGGYVAESLPSVSHVACLVTIGDTAGVPVGS